MPLNSKTFHPFEQNGPFKFELSKRCHQQVFAIATLEEAKLGHKMLVNNTFQDVRVPKFHEKNYKWNKIILFDSLCYTAKKGNIQASNISFQLIGLSIFQRRVQWTSYFPSMAIFNPTKKFDRGRFWSRARSPFLNCESLVTQSTKQRFINCNFRLTLLYGKCFYCLNWMEPITI